MELKKSYFVYSGLLMLMAYAFFVYYPSLSCGLTNWDVGPYLLDNPYIKSLTWDNLKRIFSEPFLAGYQPVTMLSWAIEYHFFKINAFEMHAVNIAFHLLNTLLVFFFIRLLSGDLLLSFLTAIFFSVHPMRVESVTWVVERKDVLYLFFYLLSLIFYSGYVIKKISDENRANTDSTATRPASFYRKLYFLYSGAVAAMILSCMSKPMGVSLTLNLFAVDFIVSRKWNKGTFLEKLPFLLVSLAFGLLALGATHFSEEYRPYSGYLSAAYADYSFIDRFLLASYAVFFYFYKFFYPFYLSVYYPNIFASGNLPGYYWIFPIILVFLFVLVIFSMKYSRKFTFGFFFFLFAVLFILPAHPTNVSLVYERYSYLAHIGIAFIVSGAVLFISRMPIIFLKLNPAWLPYFASGFAFIWVAFLGYHTRERISVWKDSNTLWSDYIAKFPEHFMGYHNRGAHWAAEGKYEYALRDFSYAINRNPSFYEAYLNRGNIYVLFKQFDKAERDYSKVIELNPRKPEIYFNRGNARWILRDSTGACSDWRKARKMGLLQAENQLAKNCSRKERSLKGN